MAPHQPIRVPSLPRRRFAHHHQEAEFRKALVGFQKGLFLRVDLRHQCDSLPDLGSGKLSAGLDGDVDRDCGVFVFQSQLEWVVSLFYVALLVFCTPAFGCLPIFIVANSFPRQLHTGDFSSTLRTAVILVSVFMFAMCAFLISFCTVVTLDPLFRSAIGLNVLRNQIPIDVKLVERQDGQDDVEVAAIEQDGLRINVEHVEQVEQVEKRTLGKSLCQHALE